MKASVPFSDILNKHLRDPETSIGYLNTAIEENDWPTFLMALKNVVDVHGGISELAKKSKLDRVHLYRLLSKNGHPHVDSLIQILQVLGLDLNVVKRKKNNKKHKPSFLRKAA